MEETPAPPQQPGAPGEEDASKECRKRKKRLLHQIADQMDFYFSAANTTKDRFMAGLLTDSPYIDLQTFFKFNKIRSMTSDFTFLKKAISKSSLLELSEDGLKVRRRTAVETKGDEMQCTIYVENVPSNADHDWVRQVFGEYGAIDYVSLPRYHRSGRPKGFAFVEFKTPEMANSALEAFGALECKIPPTIDPAQLQSIKTFESTSEEQATEASALEGQSDGQSVGDFKESGGGGTVEASGGEEENGNKKRKLDDESGEVSGKKQKASKDESESDDVAPQEGEAMEGCGGEAQPGAEGGEAPSAGGKKNKKKKRKRKKKEKEVIDSIYLRVMSKEDWKKLRNKYLNAQRDNMRLLKMQLHDRYYQPQHSSHPAERHFETAERHFETADRHFEGDNYYDEAPDTREAPPPRDTTPQKDHSLKPQFTPNSVIKISFEEPPQDPKKLRETIREGGGVAYVDVSATERDVFVRFTGEAAAAAYRKTGCWSRMEVVSGGAEEEYWRRIIACWSERRNKKNKSVKRPQGCSGELRGREKLLQKAFREAQNTKRNNHIVFDE